MVKKKHKNRNNQVIKNQKEDNIMMENNEEKVLEGIPVEGEVIAGQMSFNLNDLIVDSGDASEVPTETDPVVEQPIVETEAEAEAEAEGTTDQEEYEEEKTDEPDETGNESLSNFVAGKLEGAVRLYVRSEPSKESAEVTIIDESDKLIVNLDESTEDFYRVEVVSKDGSDSLVGFCVKKFIKID